MSDLATCRREAFKRVAEQRGGVSAVSRELGYKNPSFISQMIGPSPTREMTEKTARSFESKLGLPRGCLDQGPEAVSEPVFTAPAAQPTEMVELVASVIRLVGKACESEGVTPGPEKFASFVALAYLDAVEHNGEMREGYVKQMAHLLK